MTTFFERINPTKIILNHFRTLYNASTQKVDWIEVFLVSVGPWLASGFMIYKKVTINEDLANILFAAFAITGGFLINALVVLTDKSHQLRTESPDEERLSLLRETFYNTSFGVLVCVFSVIFCAAYPFLSNGIVQNIFTFCIFSFAFLFVHTLLMVIKRLNRIFEI